MESQVKMHVDEDDVEARLEGEVRTNELGLKSVNVEGSFGGDYGHQNEVECREEACLPLLKGCQVSNGSLTRGG